MKFYALRRKDSGTYLSLGMNNVLSEMHEVPDRAPWMTKNLGYAENARSMRTWWSATADEPCLGKGMKSQDYEVVELVVMDPGAGVQVKERVRVREGSFLDTAMARAKDNALFISGQEGFTEIPNVEVMNETVLTALETSETLLEVLEKFVDLCDNFWTPGNYQAFRANVRKLFVMLGRGDRFKEKK